MILFDNGVDVSCGEAADRVIGRGAAYLYVALKIKHVSAYVISKPAIEVLERYGIEFDSDEVADNIRNHTNTGICPMEEVTENATCPQEAIKLMKARLKQIKHNIFGIKRIDVFCDDFCAILCVQAKAEICLSELFIDLFLCKEQKIAYNRYQEHATISKYKLNYKTILKIDTKYCFLCYNRSIYNVYKFGIDIVDPEIPITAPEVDVIVKNTPLYIKTMTTSSDRWSSVKLIWTVDAQKALQFKNTYIPYCDMLMAKIHWNDNGKLLLFSKESQVGVLNQIGRDRYIKLPKVNTNARGVEISREALLILEKCQDTRCIDIKFTREKIDYREVYTKWLDAWGEDY